MCFRTLIAAALLFWATDLAGQAQDTIPVADRAQILSAVLSVRSTALPDSARFDACSLSAVFGHDPAFANRLLPWPRRLLVGQPGPGCRQAQAPGLYPTWRLRRIDVEHAYKVVVHAIVFTPQGSHYEEYEMRRTGPSESEPEWAVDRVTLSYFVQSDDE